MSVETVFRDEINPVCQVIVCEVLNRHLVATKFANFRFSIDSVLRASKSLSAPSLSLCQQRFTVKL